MMYVPGVIRYRFTGDPLETIRLYDTHPYWDASKNAWCIIPANVFDGRPYIILDDLNYDKLGNQ